MGRLLVTALIVFVAATFDVLGVHSALEPMAEKISQRLHAPMLRDLVGQKSVTVVLIDPPYMDRKDGVKPGWPLPALDFQRNLLAPILRAKPAAIFIDIAFTDMPRPVGTGGQPDPVAGTVMLARGIRDSSVSVPIVLADVMNISSAKSVGCGVDWIAQDALTEGNTISTRFRQTALDDGNGPPGNLQIAPINWIGAKDIYPIGTALASTPGACEATLDNVRRYASLQSASDNPQGGFLLSPAAVLTTIWCQQHHAWVCGHIKPVVRPKDNGGYGLYAVDEALAPPILVQWGSKQSHQMRRYFSQARNGDECRAQNDSPIWFEMLQQVFLAMLPRLDGKVGNSARSCPYFDTVSAEMVRAPERFYTPDGASAFYRDFFAGKVVLIGTSLPYAPDTLVSPVAGEIPGVFLHAAAFSNLVNAKGDYSVRPEGGSRILWDALEGVAVALLSLVFASFLEWLVKWKRFQALALRSWLRRMIAFPIVLALLSFLILLGAVGSMVLLEWGLNFANAGGSIFVAVAIFVALTDHLQRAFIGDELGGDPEALQSTSHRNPKSTGSESI